MDKHGIDLLVHTLDLWSAIQDWKKSQSSVGNGEEYHRKAFAIYDMYLRADATRRYAVTQPILIVHLSPTTLYLLYTCYNYTPTTNLIENITTQFSIFNDQCAVNGQDDHHYVGRNDGARNVSHC